MDKGLVAELNTALLDHLAEGVCLLAPEGDLVYMNLAAQEMLELAAPARHTGDISPELVAANQWTALLQTAPATVASAATTGRLTLSSQPQTVAGQPLIQVILRREAPPPAQRPVAQQVAALARISRELNATVLLEDVLAAVLDEALLNTGADGGVISLYDESGQLSRLIQRGEITSASRHDRQAVARRRAILVPELEDGSNGAGLRSALIAPILYGGDAAGMIRLFSTTPAFFDQNGETFVGALASHAAIAIGNARRFDEIQERNVLLQQRTQQLERFVESGRVFSSERPLDDVYEDLVYAIQEGVGYHAVLLSLAERDGTDYFLRHVAGAGLPLERLRSLRQERHAWAAVEYAARPKFALGGAYLLPARDAARLAPGLSLPLTGELLPEPALEFVDEESVWQRKDLFFIPMRDQQGLPLGLISLAAPLDGRRPELNSARVLEIFANQTANAIENVQLFHDMRDYAIELQQLHNVSQQVLREPDFGDKLQLIVDGMQVSAWQRVALTLCNEEYEVTRLVTSGFSREEHDHFAAHMLPAAEWRRRLEDSDFQHFRRGSSYFLPAGTPETGQSNLYGRTRPAEPLRDDGAWHPGDVLVRPLYDSEGKMAGLSTLDRPTGGRRPDERALQTIDLYAQFAISVIENVRLFNDIDRHRRELQTLFDASNALAGALDSQQILAAIGDHLQRAAGASAYTIYATGSGEELRPVQASMALLPDSLPGTTLELARQVTTTREPALLSHGDGSHATTAMLPLLIRDEPYGLVELTRDEEEGATATLTGATLPLLGAILNQGSVALEIAHLFEELDERVAQRTQALAAESERVKILLRITTELSSSLDRDRVLNLALQLVNEVVHARHGAILLADEERDELVVQAAFGDDSRLPVSGLRSGEGLAGWIIQNRQAVIVPDVRADARWVDSHPEAGDRSALGVPLISGDDVLGVMLLTDPQPARFTSQQLSLVEAAGIQAASAIHNASLYDLTRQQAERLGVLMQEAQVEVAKQQSILESIADGVLVAEAGGEIIVANMPTARMLGIPRSRLVGRPVDGLLGLYGEPGDNWVRTLQEWAGNPGPLDRRHVYQDRMEIEEHVVSIHASPVFARDRYFGAVSIFRDITREVEVDRMKSEFVSTVSHELRTPMTSIKGYADLILMGAAGPLGDAQQRYLEVIRKNADRLQWLVNDLLDISRIETGKTQLALQPLDMARLISGVVDDHVRGRIQHEGKQLAVSTEIAPSLPLVNADPEKVTRVLTNLVDNAMNYTPPGGAIAISAQPEGDFVRISVHDTGIGIAKEDHTRIFERFYRAEDEAVQAVPGTGLGLAIVQSLVAMHGGELTLQSEVGEGSTFAFTLPLMPGEDGGLL
jgi:signal transduction histidine kinase/GAF domain-containing protein